MFKYYTDKTNKLRVDQKTLIDVTGIQRKDMAIGVYKWTQKTSQRPNFESRAYDKGIPETFQFLTDLNKQLKVNNVRTVLKGRILEITSN